MDLHLLAWAPMLVALLPDAGVAQARETVRISGPSECPPAADVARELRSILPRMRVVVAPNGPSEVRISDERSRYRIAVAGSERELVDEGRRCEDRARAAAVVVALALEPPAVPRDAWRVDLDVGGIVDAA